MYGKYFVLFAILFTGWFLRKINFIDDKMNHSMNKLIVYFAYPCLIVYNIGSLDLSGRTVVDFLIALVLSLACFYIYGFICTGYAKLRKFSAESSNVAEFAMMAPNDGFMGFPVTLIFFGETGLLFMLAHNAAMNIFTFTYGLKILRRNDADRRRATPMNLMKALLKLLVNPNILALMIGFAISLIGGSIPDPVSDYLLYIGNVSTPMAMIFIGSSLAKYRFIDIIRDKTVIESGVMKLVWLPAITALLVYFLPVDDLIKAVVVLGACFPTAATVSMLAEQEGQDLGLASRILFFSTVLSIATVVGSLKLIMYIF